MATYTLCGVFELTVTASDKASAIKKGVRMLDALQNRNSKLVMDLDVDDVREESETDE